MNAAEQRKRLFDFITNFVIWLCECASFAFLWYKNYGRVFWVRGNYAIIMMYGLFIFFVTKSVNGYNSSYMRVSDRIISHLIAIVTSGVIGYIFICIAVRDYVPVWPNVCMALVQFAFALLWLLLMGALQVRLFPPRRIALIYGSYPPERFLSKLRDKADKYEVALVLDIRDGMEKVTESITQFEGVVLYDLPAEERNELMKYCYKASLRAYVVPKISDILLEGSERLYLIDTPLYLSKNTGLGPDERFVKRLADIVISLLGIVIASPFMLIIAICVKCYDRGPVFYKQTRLTRDGKTFSMMKFRSMTVDAEEDGAQLATKEDSRITPVGRVIRNIHFDELPQLFNVLKGDMSMVGPRPERPEIFAAYEKTIPEFPFRLRVKAGMTGYAQVYGRYNTAPIDKLKLDLTYIQEYSYWLDIKLLLLTVRLIFLKEYAEGVDPEDPKNR